MRCLPWCGRVACHVYADHRVVGGLCEVVQQRVHPIVCGHRVGEGDAAAIADFGARNPAHGPDGRIDDENAGTHTVGPGAVGNHGRPGEDGVGIVLCVAGRPD
eukprot:6040875-Prymnesium_polylepis.1